MAMNSSEASCPAAAMMLVAPPGCPSKNFVPSYTSPLTTNHGSVSGSCLRSSPIVISHFTLSLVIFTSFATSLTTSSTSPPPIFSPQNPFARFPPTRSIHPPDIKAGSVGCSKCKLFHSLAIVFLSVIVVGLSTMPSTVKSGIVAS